MFLTVEYILFNHLAQISSAKIILKPIRNILKLILRKKNSQPTDSSLGEIIIILKYNF